MGIEVWRSILHIDDMVRTLDWNVELLTCYLLLAITCQHLLHIVFRLNVFAVLVYYWCYFIIVFQLLFSAFDIISSRMLIVICVDFLVTAVLSPTLVGPSIPSPKWIWTLQVLDGLNWPCGCCFGVDRIFTAVSINKFCFECIVGKCVYLSQACAMTRRGSS